MDKTRHQQVIAGLISPLNEECQEVAQGSRSSCRGSPVHGVHIQRRQDVVVVVRQPRHTHVARGLVGQEVPVLLQQPRRRQRAQQLPRQRGLAAARHACTAAHSVADGSFTVPALELYASRRTRELLPHHTSRM